MTRDLVTLNHTLSISHSPCSLAAGPIRNAENMESLLAIPIVRIPNAKFIFILGKYGKILKVAVNQSTAYAGTQVSFFSFRRIS